MRSDYALYAVAAIFFVITLIVAAYQIEFKELFVVSTAVLGLFFVGLGYTQRARPRTTTMTQAPPSVPSTQQIVAIPPQESAPVQPVVQVTQEPTVAAATEPSPAEAGLTEVRGIGGKRAEQLRNLGITNVEALANASARDLGKRLLISPKITAKWIENAKQLVEKK